MPKPIKRCADPKIITDLRDLVVSNAEKFGDTPLYHYKENKEIKTFSHKDQLEQMNALGTAFAKCGLMGKHIAVIGETHPNYMTAYFATVNGGGVIVPLDRELELEQIVNFCNLAEAEAIVYTKSFNKKLLPMADKMPGVKYFIPIHAGEDENEKVVTYQRMLEIGKEELDKGNRSFLDHEIDLEKCCAIIFTSGTTGTSKGVMLTQKNLTTATNSACQTMQVDYRNTMVSVLPIHHTYECTCEQLALPNCGSQMYINDGLKNTMKSFAYFKPNTLVLVPLYVETMYKRIWAEIDKKGMTKKVKFAMKLSNALLKAGIDLRDKFFKQIKEAFGGNLRSIICGGAPLSPKLVEDFETFGITIIEGYGITECSPLVAVNDPNNVILHSVGFPVYGCEVKIDKERPEDETGEILARGGNVMLGYYKNPEATAEVFTEDGFFRTGDIGFIDKKGAVHITGRKKNVIILSNGKNVFPEEVEEHMAECSYINEIVVIGRENDNGEVVITAIVYPDYEKLGEDMPADKVLEAVKEQIFEVNRKLPSFKQVREVEIRTVEFEKNTSRKIKRFLIK